MSSEQAIQGEVGQVESHDGLATPTLYGIAAEFDNTDDLLDGVRQARAAGYVKMDAYSPMPVEGLSEAIGFRNKVMGFSQMPMLMLLGGITGAVTGLVMQWAAYSHFYPLNIGGRPYFSWPMFIVPAFEMTIGFAALTGVFGMIILNGLPQPYHPMFNAPNFNLASSNRFFLCIESDDPQFDRAQTVQFMRGMKALQVSEVAN